MLRFTVLIFVAIIPAAFNQLISFKDGKIGVNFAGFNAEAGLGGLVTGNAAHGGLSASAGTPFGQKAGAGIGGSVDNGQAKGGGYAGASAGYGVGASAALGGNVDEFGAAGGEGTEAHAGGISTKTVILSQTPQRQPQQRTFVSEKELEFSKGVTSVDQRSSFANESPAKPSVEQQLPAAIPSGRRFYKRKHIRRLNRGRNKLVQLERRFDAPETRENSYEPHSQPQANFDYRKFLDFGFFSNAGATFAGAPHPATQNGQVFSFEKQISPNTILLHKTVIPKHHQAEVNVDQRFDADDEGYDVVTKSKTKSKANYGGGSSGAATYTATKQFQPNPNFFNDIFNIPISTLGAVSQFLSNGANSGFAVSKTKTVEHS